MKALYKGIEHHKIKKGEYDIKINGNTIETKGDGFDYSFTYSSQEQLEKDWEILKKEILYMVVDVENKELPLFVGTIEEVAEWAKTTKNNIRSAISHAKKKNQKSKFVRVKV